MRRILAGNSAPAQLTPRYNGTRLCGQESDGGGDKQACTVVTRVMTMWAAKFHDPETDIRRLAGGRLKCSTVDTSLRHRAVTMWAAKPAALRVTEE